MNKVDTRIEKIKSDHANLLKMVRESILKNRYNFDYEIDEVIGVLDFDEKSINKFEAMVNAQELIVSLVQQILDAKNVEDVLNIRKKLNYYINKIKSELKKRNVKQTIIDKYQEKSNFLRKDIAKYIRFLKRENNIADIEKLYSNYDNLTKEEMETLKKALKREVNYNTRNINPPKKKEIKKEVVDVKIKKKENDQEEKDNVIQNLNEFFRKYESTKKRPDPSELVFEFSKYKTNQDQSDLKDEDFEFSSQFERETTYLHDNEKIRDISEVNFDDVDDYLEKKVSAFSSMYNIAKTYDYQSKGMGKNTINFFRNIPNYIHNKKALKAMYRDYNIFYGGNDLASYIEYIKRRNSIRQGLKCIFKRSYLYSQEAKYLNCHDNCSWWLFNYCKNNSMNLPVSEKFHL